MEPTSDRRFDSHRAARLLLEIAQELSLGPVLRKIVEHAVEDTEFVFTPIWLVENADLCATCKYRSKCPDKTRCLHLVAGKGSSLLGPEKGLRAYEDLNARVPLSFGALGEAVASGQERVVTNSEKQPVSIPGFDWLLEEDIHSYAICPIRSKRDVLGALVGFTREPFPEVSRPWVGIFADHVGAAVANSRAFEEIQRLKGQLELHNAYLQEAVVEA